jgi:hypothetical protein
MSPEAIADLAIKYAREYATNSGDQRVAFAFAKVEDIVREAIQDAVREVNITAPGVVIEDRREHGGAIVSDLRGVQDKANG